MYQRNKDNCIVSSRPYLGERREPCCCQHDPLLIQSRKLAQARKEKAERAAGANATKGGKGGKPEGRRAGGRAGDPKGGGARSGGPVPTRGCDNGVGAGQTREMEREVLPPLLPPPFPLPFAGSGSGPTYVEMATIAALVIRG